MTKFTAKEIEFMKVVCSYKRVIPTHGQIAMKLNKDQRSITGTFFRMRERHRVRSNEELIKLFKERFPNDTSNCDTRSNGNLQQRESLQKSNISNQFMQDSRSNECNI